MPATVSTMDFFQYQAAARRRTGMLVFYYALAVILIVIGVYLAFALTFIGAKAKSTGAADFDKLWNPELFVWIAGITSLVIVAGSLYKVYELGKGGEAIALMLGGRRIQNNTTDPDERKILNVVEEMAIASGTPVPPVFLLDEEDGINAFAAGFSPGDAVIGVTRGAVSALSRDELQGVVAHEFSHIFNGDMRLNLRLIGVLNGILIISMIGYWTLRTALRSGGRPRSSSRKGGNPLPIALLGLILMILGYIGVFFGKLIKAAVSRQREFLADASAVQFTRHPEGLACALKKIGAITAGSRIQNDHAEEASHFFFANGLRASIFGLMSTHPPLNERIRRIDPSFDGDFKKAPTPLRQGQPAGEPAVSGLTSDPTGGTSRREKRIKTAPESLTASVGTIRPEHLAYAASLIQAIPAVVVNAARDPFSARALVSALLVNKEPAGREAQMNYLAALTDSTVRTETLKLLPEIDRLGPEFRLPLLDMALVSLKNLSPAQYTVFRSAVEALIHADRETDLFEFTLQRMINSRLDPAFGIGRRAVVQYYDLKPLLSVAGELLSCLAYWGTDSVNDATRSFSRGKERLRGGASLRLSSLDNCGLTKVDQALGQLSAASAQIRKEIIEACTACIASDGRVTSEEAELLRAIGASLDCPIPLLIPGEKLAA